MSSSTLKIDCIKRLINVSAHADLINFLIDEKVLDKSELVKATNNKETAETIFFAINSAVKANHINLADFEWFILPKELIKLTIVTSHEHKIFTFGL